jgi:hypothetical protein
VIFQIDSYFGIGQHEREKGYNHMAVNDPYSRDAVDLKLENLFQRFQMESTRRDERMLEEFRKIDASFRGMEKDIRLMEKDINWIKVLLTGSNLALLVTLVGVIVPMAWTLWANLTHMAGP